MATILVPAAPGRITLEGDSSRQGDAGPSWSGHGGGAVVGPVRRTAAVPGETPGRPSTRRRRGASPAPDAPGPEPPHAPVREGGHPARRQGGAEEADRHRGGDEQHHDGHPDGEQPRRPAQERCQGQGEGVYGPTQAAAAAARSGQRPLELRHDTELGGREIDAVVLGADPAVRPPQLRTVRRRSPVRGHGPHRRDRARARGSPCRGDVRSPWTAWPRAGDITLRR